MKDRLSKLNVLVVRYKYDLREDNDIIELSKNEEMLKREPFIDIVIGPQSYHQINNLLKKHVEKKKRRGD